MLAIYRKELKLGFSSLSTYLLISLFLLSFGILSILFNLFYGYASLSYPLGYMTLFSAILLPFLVFFSVEREKKTNAEALFRSLPLSPSSLALGSFLGQATVLFIPTLIFALFPLLFSLFGNSLITTSETALLGFFLYELLLLSLNRVLFAGINKPFLGLPVSVLSNLFLYFLNYLFFYAPFEGWLSSLSSLFNPTGVCYSFTYGKINLPGILYFITFTGVLLFAEILLIKKRRGDFSNQKRKIRTSCILALTLVFLLTANTLFSLLPEKIANVDVTGTDIFRISDTSASELHGLDSSVEIYFLCEGGKSAADKDFLSFLKKYEEESEYLTLQVIDTAKDTEFLSSYTDKKLSNQSLIVKGAERYRIIDQRDLYYYQNDLVGTIPAADYEYLIQSYVAYLQNGSLTGLNAQSVALGEKLYYSTETVAYFDGDSVLCNAIRFVSHENIPSVYIASTDAFSRPDTIMEDILTENGFFVSYLASLESIPKNCDILILFSPKKDLTENEQISLSSYLSGGGNLFLATDYSKTEHPRLLEILSQYGLGTAGFSNVVCEGDKSTHITEEFSSLFFTKIAPCPATGDSFKGVYASLDSHCITLTQKEGVTLTPWITTTEKGILLDPDEKEIIEENETYCCGAIAKKEESTVIWIGSPLSVSSTGYVYSEGGNFLLFLSSFRWMCPSDFQKLSISPSVIDSSALFVSDGNLAIWGLILAVILPLIPISIGIIYTYVRKKR